MGLFSKKAQQQPPYVPQTIIIGPGDLAEASALIDQWDRSLGNSNATWATLEAIARRGGFVNAVDLMRDMTSHDIPADIAVDKPWRWWATASTTALSNGDTVLPARIFLFAKLFITQTLPNMNAANQMDVGLGKPKDDTYRTIASNGAAALAQLPANRLIHDTATGKVDVAAALTMAQTDAAS